MRCRADFIAAIRRVHNEAALQGPLLLCLVTGDEPDPCCERMPRDPAPPTGARFDDTFATHLKAAIAINPAIHDGAVLLRRRDVLTSYCIEGWSYRLMAPTSKECRPAPNKGSAYNSCLATSSQAGVDAVYLLSRGLLTVFIDGFENQTVNMDNFHLA